jgi:hypothetical protein
MKIHSGRGHEILLLLLILVACNNNKYKTTTGTPDDTVMTIGDSLQLKKETGLPKTFSNKRFRNVTVERSGQDSLVVRGQGQIFEASFNWVVEDGHEELQKGYHMTDAGAPEWGNFELMIKARKKRPNSTLTLILFESSPRDGSRQHELPIPLY